MAGREVTVLNYLPLLCQSQQRDPRWRRASRTGDPTQSPWVTDSYWMAAAFHYYKHIQTPTLHVSLTLPGFSNQITSNPYFL